MKVRDCPFRIKQADYQGFKQGRLVYWSCKKPRVHNDAGVGCPHNGNKNISGLTNDGLSCYGKQIASVVPITVIGERSVFDCSQHPMSVSTDSQPQECGDEDQCQHFCVYKQMICPVWVRSHTNLPAPAPDEKCYIITETGMNLAIAVLKSNRLYDTAELVLKEIRPAPPAPDNTEQCHWYKEGECTKEEWLDEWERRAGSKQVTLITRTSELPRVIPPLPKGDTKDLKVWKEYWEEHDAQVAKSERERVLKGKLEIIDAEIEKFHKPDLDTTGTTFLNGLLYARTRIFGSEQQSLRAQQENQ